MQLGRSVAKSNPDNSDYDDNNPNDYNDDLIIMVMKRMPAKRMMMATLDHVSRPDDVPYLLDFLPSADQQRLYCDST